MVKQGTTAMAQDTETQRLYFNQAVIALGGQRATARMLDINERTMRGLCSGERPLHDGYLRDVAALLLKHADHCRDLERKLSPAFSGNLTERQQQGPGPRAHKRYDRRSAGAVRTTTC